MVMTRHGEREARGRQRGENPAASRALFWSFTNTAVSRLGTLGIGIVLARLLGPQAFGTYAVAFVALAAVLSFNELGVSLAIVRWPGDPRAIAPTVTTISVFSSLVIFIAGFFAAGPFAEAMGDPGAEHVVQLLLLSVLVNGAVATPAAGLQREFRQGTRMIIDQVNVWVGAVISVVLAVAGMGAMSLAIGRIAGTAISAGMFIFYSPFPYRFGWDREHVRPLLGFGLPLAGASLIVFAVGYADQLIVGHLLGATMLGFYVLAFNLASWPVSMFSQPLRSVAPAAFSRLQHAPREMSDAFLAFLRVLAAVAIPVCFFLAGSAEPVIRFVYGAAWAPAAQVLSWLAVLGAFRILFELAYDYIVVLRKSGSLLAVQVIWLVALVPALLGGAWLGGIAGVALAQVVVAAVVVLPIYLWRLAGSGIGLPAFGARVWLPVLVGGAVTAAGIVLGDVIASSFLAALSAGLLALAAMGLMLYWQRATLAVLRDFGSSRRPADQVPSVGDALDRS
jgi:O-antigen/teichoic acid export membrane protein